MTICIFAGPTVSAKEILAVSDVEVLPPAAMGDVIQAVRCGASCIGIIDGYFEGQPSVWHKEVLWAIDKGVDVFGAASIGALRAAELHAFGMVGVGRIFEDYLSGATEDDDEVALVHGPADLGYPCLSVPMVNVRATIAKAVLADELSQNEASVLVGAAKRLHFSQRTWELILEPADGLSVDPDRLLGFKSWVADNSVDQKKHDALQMLTAIDSRKPSSAAQSRFEWTVMWDKALKWRENRAEDNSTHGVIDELRLTPQDFVKVRRFALARLLAARRRSRLHADAGERIQDALARLRQDQHILTRRDLDAWLSENGLDEEKLTRLLQTEIAIETAVGSVGPDLESAMIDELKLTGRYAALAARAAAKTGTVSEQVAGTSTPSAAMLLDWFTRVQAKGFDAENAEELVEKLALPDLVSLTDLIAGEFFFQKNNKAMTKSDN